MYFGHGTSPTDMRSYREAERRYFQFLGEREATVPVEVELQTATVRDVCEQYLQQLGDRHARGEISANHCDRSKIDLHEFAEFVGPDERFNSILEVALENYRNYTLNAPVSRCTGHPIKPATIKGRLVTVKTLYKWAYKLYILERLPRNLDDLAKLPPNAIKPRLVTFTLDELKLLFANVATSHLRCCMLLALGCGMGQGDISDLRMKEVDWEGGYIDRERSKTKVRSRHKLWPETLELLKQHRHPLAAGDDRVLLNEDGLPLVRRKINGDTYQKCDAIKLRFDRLLRKTKLNSGRSFYCLRKTGATLIESIDPAATEMFLSHSEKTMKKAYAQRDFARLDRALDQMRAMLETVVFGQA